MRRAFTAGLLLVSGAAAQGQSSNSTTNCFGTGYSVQCSTTTAQQPDWNQIGANLGRAIALRRERKREEKALKEAADQRAAIMAKISALNAADTAPAEPPPADEKPVTLACNIQGTPASLALYEKHSRLDSTANGVTRTRKAAFSESAVTWGTPLLQNSISRVDGSYLGIPNIPEIAATTRLTGTCVVSSERKF